MLSTYLLNSFDQVLGLYKKYIICILLVFSSEVAWKFEPHYKLQCNYSVIGTGQKDFLIIFRI